MSNFFKFLRDYDAFLDEVFEYARKQSRSNVPTESSKDGIANVCKGILSSERKVSECQCNEKCNCSDTNDTCTCTVPSVKTTLLSSNGWVNNDGVFTRKITVPVEKEYLEVKVLDEYSVNIWYKKEVEVDESFYVGKKTVQGEFSLPLPDDADPTSVKAKCVQNSNAYVLELSVNALNTKPLETVISVSIE
jgi:hypothetical protein